MHVSTSTHAVLIRLPEIQDEIRAMLEKTRAKLRLLPMEPSNDAFGEVLKLIHTFIDDVTKHVEGIPDEDGLLQKIRPAQRSFKFAIRDTAPAFVPYERRFAGTKMSAEPTFLIDEDGEKIRHFYWDCPWSKKKNTWEISAPNDKYVVESWGENLDSGALGSITVTVLNNPHFV